MDHKSERGAVLIEAALSLTIFMFTMLTLFSMYHVCLAQARIGAALNATAKEISQYSYVYSMTGLNDKQAGLANQGGAAQGHLSDNLSEVNSLYDAFMGVAGTVMAVPDNSESFIAYALNEGIEQLKGSACGVMARGLMRKHFGSDPDKYLEGLGIEGGTQGLSFIKTRLFADGESEEIILNVRYQVTVIKLLNIDMKLNFEQCAQTRAWVA